LTVSFVVDTLSERAPAKKSCTSTRVLAAADIHKKLVGTGLEIECQQFTNNSVQSRTKWVCLKDYGVAIQTESTGSAYKTVIRVVDVND
jgi:hypothetical protein